MTAIVALEAVSGPDVAGHKAWNLARLASSFCVPRALVVSRDVLLEALGPDRLDYLGHFCAEQKATVGCFLPEAAAELGRRVADVELPAGRRRELVRLMAEVFGDDGRTRFAVRSSAVHEDSARSSYAGVYHSELDLPDGAAACDAIGRCWRQYFSYSAVAARLCAGDFDPAPGLALIVQEMVPARLAGVAFSRAPAGAGGGAAAGGAAAGPLVEYVAGTGDALVSGRVTPRRYPGGRPDAEDAPALEAVLEMTRAVERAFGCPVDIEWAWDGAKLFLLQARPVAGAGGAPAAAGAAGGAAAGAAAGVAAEAREPVLDLHPLYQDRDLTSGVNLGPVRPVYDLYVAKRGRAYRLAAHHGIATGAAYVVEFNGLGLDRRGAELAAAFAATPAPEAVVDASDNLRQVIVAKGELGRFLAATFGAGPASRARHAAVVRDYIRGQFGFISRLVGDGGLLIEFSPDGLLGINRGLAACRHIARDGPPPDGRLTSDAAPGELDEFLPGLEAVDSFTRALSRELGGAQLEWVLDRRRPYFVDFSRTAADLGWGEELAGTTAIAPGRGRGPVLPVDDGDLLERLSIGPAVSVGKYDQAREHEALRRLIDAARAQPVPPVVWSPRPYAILSALIGHVAGFIFSQGSLLCHLAVQLRERGVPAVIAPGPRPPAGAEALIDGGRLTIF